MPGKGKMRVLMYYSNNDVRLQEMPVPEIGPGEMLVKVRASGICGSDVMEWYRIKKAPRVLGHEIAGEVWETGPDVGRYRKGDRVFVSHHVPCNTCHYCLNGHHTACDTLHTTNFDPGGFAEYVRIPELNVDRGVYLLPDSLSYETGTFIEPLACVLRGQRLAGIGAGQSLLVIGTGISGLIHIALARALGASFVAGCDVNEKRREAAAMFGADIAVAPGPHLPEAVRGSNNGRLADVVVVCAGALSAAEQALECVDRGGTVLYFAVPEPGVMLSVPINDLWRNEVRLMTSYGASPADIEKAVTLLAGGRVKLDDMITHRLGFNEGGRGFKLVAGGTESIKVIFDPWKDS